MNIRLKTTFYLGLAAACIAVQSRGPALAQAAAPMPNYQGVYALINPRVTPAGNRTMFAQYVAALANPNVDGATIIIPWSDLYSTANPGPGNYNWAELDSWLNYAIALNKKLSIGVVAGMNVPTWMLHPPYNVPAYNFTFNSGALANAHCVTRLLPVPWGPTYVALYDQMIMDLSSHLHATGAYNALRIVKMDGLNEETQELGIGATRAADYSCPLNQSNYLTEGWAALGYTPNAIATAWANISQTIATAFPDQLLSVDVLANQGGFPSVNNAAQIVAPPAGGTDATTQYLMNTTFSMGSQQSAFSNRISVQWDALSNGTPDPEVMVAQAMGAKMAWQLNDRMGVLGAGCMVSSNVFAVCQSTPAFQAILDYGIALGGKFIELMPVDVIAYPAALQEPHNVLAGTPE